MKPFPGYFITVEGGEGSGKSTLLSQLALFLEEKRFQVIKTREPGGTPLGEKVRRLLLDQDETMTICSQAELLLFLASRAQHIKEIIQPALQEGKILLCDRFNDSTIAYQGAARGLKSDYVQQLCHLVCGSIVPQLTLFLDVDPEIGLMRTNKLEKEHAATGQFDRIEKEAIDFHQRVQAAFRALSKNEPLRIYTIDANQSQENVFKDSVNAIKKLIS